MWIRKIHRVAAGVVLWSLAAAGQLAAATFTVDNTANLGPGSLRQAILDANGSAGADDVFFGIPVASCPGGVCTIALSGGLPAVTDQLTIDGTTQTETIEIDVNSATNGLIVRAPNCVVRGLVINDYATRGILLQNAGTNAVIAGNFIGTDASGGAVAAAGAHGIHVQTGGNLIGGATAADRNVIAGNGNGIRIDSNATGNTIRGNFIGIAADGATALGNANGVSLSTGVTGTTVGGTTAADRNVISGNTERGVVIGAGASGNVVSGNFIGTDAAGTAAVPNVAGVVIGGAATSNTIGGTAAGAGNVISGNDDVGVAIFNTGTSGNLVQGNLIGTDVSGGFAIPNSTVTGAGGSAVVIGDSASGNTIGGAAAGARNLISGNASDGVQIVTSASGNLVQGNWIGIDLAGTAALPNGRNGVLVWSDPNAPVAVPDNVIGGLGAGEGNVISNHPSFGVAVDNVGPGNRVLGNLIGSDPTGAFDMGNAVGVTVARSTSGEIQANRILFNGTGVELDAGGSFAASSTGNCIVFNTAGVENLTGAGSTFDQNWWGAVDGPSGAGGGSGDSVSVDVVFAPFLAAPPAGCPGFDADLSIAKVGTPDPAIAGQALSYLVTVDNAGPGAASGVQVADVLPAGLTLVSTTGCAEDPAGVPLCTLGLIPAGSSAAFTIDVVVDEGIVGDVTNGVTVTATEPDPNPGGETASATVSVLSPVEVLEIPTLDSIGLGVLALLLVFSALWLVRRRSVS